MTGVTGATTALGESTKRMRLVDFGVLMQVPSVESAS